MARKVLTFNVQAAEPDELQGRSKLEKVMQEWFEGKGTKFVLWGPGGTGKSTLARNFAAWQAEGGNRLVFVLSGGSMAQDYAGLLGESCMQARVSEASAEGCRGSSTGLYCAAR
jgi:hypothetical protein